MMAFKRKNNVGGRERTPLTLEKPTRRVYPTERRKA